MRTLTILFLSLWAVAFAAETGLVVNGVSVGGSTSDLVPGVSYVPVAPFIDQLGAAALPDQSGNTLRLIAAGRFLELPVVAPADAQQTTIRFDGTGRSGYPAVHQDGTTYIPVKVVAEAFGASVTFITEQKRVVVTQPRPRFSRMSVQDTPSERLVLRLSAPARYDLTFIDQRTLELSFPRVDTELFLPPVRGTLFTEARVEHRGETVVVRVTAPETLDARVVELPHAGGRGFDLLLVFATDSSGAGIHAGANITIDPAFGGDTPGQQFSGYGSEAELTYQLAKRMQDELATHGVAANITRAEHANPAVLERSLGGLGADLFISLHGADLPVGEFSVYYLGDATDIATLDYAIRVNASSDIDELRREILLRYQVDLATGRSLAEALGQRLSALGGYRLRSVQAAPLQVLGGAAGRGVFIELSPADLASPTLAEHLATATLELLDRFGTGQ